MLQVSWSCEVEPAAPILGCQRSLSPHATAVARVIAQLAVSLSRVEGCSRVWGGHGTGVTGREGERQHAGTDASYVWLLLRPPARIGGASAVDVTDGEAGP